MKESFSPPDMSELEMAEVLDAIQSGWITTGPKTKEFERKIDNLRYWPDFEKRLG